ncbi:Methyl-accepting chemotaxis protein I (serine chemoreceptor protein) [hydrothermal vent metagenome]|uniref:Methyl-accepting chemotaxis protein I (Serine chemoreceptor protein) n=1 Tax=hydrothermal vent metagenome TaxID=652676 RepID=A0A3B0Z1Z4_9ZZZZ
MRLFKTLNHSLFGRLKLRGKYTLTLGIGLAILISAMVYQAKTLQQGSLGNMLEASKKITQVITNLQISQNRLSTRENAAALGKLLASFAPNAMVSYDIITLLSYARMSVKSPGISYVAFIDKDNKSLGEVGDKQKVMKRNFIDTKINYANSYFGKVIIGFNNNRINASIQKSNQMLARSHKTIQQVMDDSLSHSTNRLIYIGLAFLIFALLITYLSASSMSKKLHSIISVMQSISSGTDKGARCTIEDEDELGEVTTEFNKMANSLEEAAIRDYENITELQHAADISEKVNDLLNVVTAAAQGDLTGEVEVSGHDSIDRLGEGISNMIQNLSMLVKQVQESGITVTSSATEIAATAKEQEATVTEQAASTNEIMATVTEISATTKDLVKTMEEVSSVSDGAADSASEGHDALTSMESTMKQMDDATVSISSKLAILNDKASNINNVVITINKVADQTNLLSLNAAIEAEKAGEYGRGFAVVATEIRRLADQTAVATWDIEQMVKEMQSAVSAGVMGMDKFSEEVNRGVEEVREVGGRLAHIIQQVQTLTPRFDAVSHGMQTQSNAASQISDSMSQLNDTAHQTVDSLHQSNQTIQQLKSAAKQLQDSVSRFKIRRM